VGFFRLRHDGGDWTENEELFQSRFGFSPACDTTAAIGPRTKSCFNPGVGFLPRCVAWFDADDFTDTG
jgi:hypothetical protein